MKPGEVRPAAGRVELSAGRERVELAVYNASDRRIGIGSHASFAQVARDLEFDREAARATHLDVPAGQITWFEPGERRGVTLVAFGGEADRA